jgi:hypothetical protein
MPTAVSDLTILTPDHDDLRLADAGPTHGREQER